MKKKRKKKKTANFLKLKKEKHIHIIENSIFLQKVSNFKKKKKMSY